MLFVRRTIFVVLTLSVTTAWGQSNTREPHIGYLYPAGGQQGSVVLITAGGQFLRGLTDVYVSGEGVHASVIQYMPPLRNLQREQRQLLQSRMKEVRDMRLAELSGTDSYDSMPPNRKIIEKNSEKSGTTKNANDAKTKEVKLPDHPLLYDLDNKSLRELAHITNFFFSSRGKRQPNRQIAESVLIEIKIDPDALPGKRELRLKTPNALTNPMIFHVGVLPEAYELEPNNRQAIPDLPNLPKEINIPKEKSVDVPVLLNGQILPGDVDRFRFRARQGQKLIMEVQARTLIPYLADAVPGWFQATLALYDAEGNEVAFVDDYRFNPDPVLFYQIPNDGEYELEIRDSIYRGREDFIYRIAVSEQPFITQIFPLGGQSGVKTSVSIAGWNLSDTRLPLDTQPGDNSIRQTVYPRGELLSNSISYAVDELAECNEAESNDTIKDAQQIALPKIINGRIDERGDVDVFQFHGHAGNNVAAEVYARRLNSPLDSLIRVSDASGNILKWNDDNVIEDNKLYKDIMGLITHQADSYLIAELPKNGTYYVHLTDSQHHGGQAFSYRLRISAPQPDFALCVTPSSLSMNAAGTIPVTVYALRKDGFEGEIEVVLKDAPAGFEISGGRIPAGNDSVRMTLTVPLKASEKPIVLQLTGLARIDGETISHRVVPADNVMQAFLYRHLVPSQELLIMIQKAGRRMPPVELTSSNPVRIPAGGTSRVLIKIQRRRILNELQLELSEPPEGVTLHDVTVEPEGLSFLIKTDKDAIQSDFANNLIVEVFREYTPRQQEGRPAPQKRRTSIGFFPAVPIEIVQQ